MQCNLYTITADPRQLVKVTSTTPYISAIANIEPTQPVNILAPTFIFNNNSQLYPCNYLYCDTFSRYYYIRNIRILPGGRIAIDCTVDVLQTYASSIKNCNATITRYERRTDGSTGPTEIPDSKLPVLPGRKDIDSITVFNRDISDFSNDVRAENYLVITIGGGT